MNPEELHNYRDTSPRWQKFLYIFEQNRVNMVIYFKSAIILCFLNK
jgi:hypothetical protein